MGESSNSAKQTHADYREGQDIQKQHSIAAREQAEPMSGSHPVSLVLFLVCALILLFGGAYYGQMTGGFDFNQFTAVGYKAAPDPRLGGKEVVKAWHVVQMDTGAKVYTACGGCHKSKGEGDVGQNIPPLVNSEWVTGSTERLAMIILNGVKDPIEVHGKVWSGNNMASQAASVPDAKRLAAVMNYVRKSFGNETDDWVSEEMAQAAIDISAARAGAQMTATELNASHDKMLPGDTVDPETGLPAGAAPAEGEAPVDPAADAAAA